MDLETASASAPGWQYDVLLNFVGMDYHGFIALLQEELQTAGNLKILRCNESFKTGSFIPTTGICPSPQLIKRSRFAIVVLSRAYASSEFCLKLLTQIFLSMEDKNRILPIYYDVDPADVLYQTGSYAHAFTEHEQFAIYKSSLPTWRHSLEMVANLPGWNLQDYE